MRQNQRSKAYIKFPFAEGKAFQILLSFPPTPQAASVNESEKKLVTRCPGLLTRTSHSVTAFTEQAVEPRDGQGELLLSRKLPNVGVLCYISGTAAA